MGFGGFLGMAEKYHPIPWSALDYEKDAGGYVVPYSKEQLEVAPNDTLEELSENDGYGARDAAYAYYKFDRYWN